MESRQREVAARKEEGGEKKNDGGRESKEVREGGAIYSRRFSAPSR